MTREERKEFVVTYRMPEWVYDLSDHDCAELSRWADARAREVAEAKLARNRAEARAERAEEALRPFAEAADRLPNHPDTGIFVGGFTVADLRRARADLSRDPVPSQRAGNTANATAPTPAAALAKPELLVPDPALDLGDEGDAPGDSR